MATFFRSCDPRRYVANTHCRLLLLRKAPFVDAFLRDSAEGQVNARLNISGNPRLVPFSLTAGIRRRRAPYLDENIVARDMGF